MRKSARLHSLAARKGEAVLPRTVLITDVTRFIGMPGSKALLEEGYKVFGTDPDFTDDGKRSAYEKACPGATALLPGSPDTLVTEVVKKGGALDVLINNDAYPAHRAAVEEASDTLLAETFETLFFKAYAMARAAVPQMKKQGSGKIIFNTSAAPLNGLRNYSVYVSARGAANALARTLAVELAADNIQVNAVAPNFVDNPDYFPPELMADPDKAARILKNIPMGRLGKPEEAASLLTYLASENSSFITGQIIPLAGGWASAR